jgi:tetratricopeptide (TPR) repeat protein
MQRDFSNHLHNIANQYEDINRYIVILDENKKDTTAWNNLGKALFHRSLFEEAIKCYDAVIEIDPKYIDAYINKGNGYYYLKNYEEAIKCYDAVIEIDPDNIDSLAGLGSLYADYMFDFPKALEQSRKLRKMTDDPDTNMNLAEDLLKVGEYKEARKYAIEALATTLDNTKQTIIRLHILCSYMLEKDLNNTDKQLCSFYDSLRDLDQNFKINEEDWVFNGLIYSIANGSANLQAKFILLTLIDILMGKVNRSNMSTFSQVAHATK